MISPFFCAPCVSSCGLQGSADRIAAACTRADVPQAMSSSASRALHLSASDSSRYDYREVWLHFVEHLTVGESWVHDLATRIVDAVLTITGCRAGSLARGGGCSFSLASRKRLGHAAPAGGRGPCRQSCFRYGRACWQHHPARGDHPRGASSLAGGRSRSLGVRHPKASRRSARSLALPRPAQ